MILLQNCRNKTITIPRCSKIVYMEYLTLMHYLRSKQLMECKGLANAKFPEPEPMLLVEKAYFSSSQNQCSE
jgi:hypothetical protein